MPDLHFLLQIGQRHGGFLGLLQRALARASPHIWFERSEVKDREAVAIRYDYLNVITFFCPIYFIFYIDYQFHILYELLIHYIFCRLKKHVSDPTNPPILIFPEGTCINNTSVMQFKKGSFEVDSIVYPVAIKVIFYHISYVYLCIIFF